MVPRPAEMEQWLHVGECRAVPSAFTTQCSCHSTPVTVVANGCRFIHVLDSIGRQELVGLE